MSLKSSFKKTNLDLTKAPGPNRTNSKNIPSGQYKNLKTSNLSGWTFNSQEPGGALKDKDGKEVNTALHQWTPDNTYMDSFVGKPYNSPPLEPLPSNPKPPLPNLPTI